MAIVLVATAVGIAEPVPYRPRRWQLAGLVFWAVLFAPLVETLGIALVQLPFRRMPGPLPFGLATAMLAALAHQPMYPLKSAWIGFVFLLYSLQYAAWLRDRGWPAALIAGILTHATNNAVVVAADACLALA